MKQLALFLAIIASLTFYSPCPLWAEASAEVGYIAAVRGKAWAVGSEGTTRKLSLKSPVYQNDTVHTNSRSRLQIVFSDNTIISLGRSTEMKIANYQWDAEAKQGAMKTHVTEGIFRVLGGAITKNSPEHFTTETPIATIGIRGSMYAGRIKDSSLSVVL